MFNAKVICDSISPAGVRLTTIEGTFPRFILAEVNTHRMLGRLREGLFDSDADLSRSSASSRAIPVEKRIKMIEEDPFVPEVFGKNQKGMQSTEELEGENAEGARLDWHEGKAQAILIARRLAKRDVHKQYANRVLEPYCWHTAVITATEWGNVDALRAHPDAQPEFQKFWRMVIAAREASRPRQLGIGEWHLPYVHGVDEDVLRDEEGFTSTDLAEISCARSGRVSHLTQDGKRDPWEDIKLYDRFLSAFHMSPLEHAATPYDRNDYEHRRVAMCRLEEDNPSAKNIWIGNYRGWVQKRKLVVGEHDFSLRSPRS